MSIYDSSYTFLETNHLVHVDMYDEIQIWKSDSSLWARQCIDCFEFLKLNPKTVKENIEYFKDNKWLGLASIYDFKLVPWSYV